MGSDVMCIPVSVAWGRWDVVLIEVAVLRGWGRADLLETRVNR